jgi:hypothetical protein
LRRFFRGFITPESPVKTGDKGVIIKEGEEIRRDERKGKSGILRKIKGEEKEKDKNNLVPSKI